MLLSAALHPWLIPRREALSPLDRISEQARAVGDPEFAHYARFLKVTGEGLAGENVERTERALDALAESVRRAGHWYPEPRLVHRAYRLLVDSMEAGRIEAEVTAIDAEVSSSQGSALPYMRTFCMLALTVHGRFDLAWAQSEALAGSLERVVPFVHVADHTFLRGLAAAALATSARGRLRRVYRRALRKARRSLKSWAVRGPDFAHMSTFLEAENARLRGRLALARTLYERAAARADAQGFTHHAALAYERHGGMLEASRRMLDAERERRKAVSLYARWGSVSKTKALEQLLSQVVQTDVGDPGNLPGASANRRSI